MYVLGSAVRLDLLWQVTYILIAITLSTALPFAFFYCTSYMLLPDADADADVDVGVDVHSL